MEKRRSSQHSRSTRSRAQSTYSVDSAPDNQSDDWIKQYLLTELRESEDEESFLLATTTKFKQHMKVRSEMKILVKTCKEVIRSKTQAAESKLWVLKLLGRLIDTKGFAEVVVHYCAKRFKQLASYNFDSGDSAELLMVRGQGIFAEKKRAGRKAEKTFLIILLSYIETWPYAGFQAMKAELLEKGVHFPSKYKKQKKKKDEEDDITDEEIPDEGEGHEKIK